MEVPAEPRSNLMSETIPRRYVVSHFHFKIPTLTVTAVRQFYSGLFRRMRSPIRRQEVTGITLGWQKGMHRQPGVVPAIGKGFAGTKA